MAEDKHPFVTREEKLWRRAGAKEVLDRVLAIAREMLPPGPVQRRFEMRVLHECGPMAAHRCKVTLEGSFYQCGTFGQYCSEECWERGKRRANGRESSEGQGD